MYVFLFHLFIQSTAGIVNVIISQNSFWPHWINKKKFGNLKPGLFDI